MKYTLELQLVEDEDFSAPYSLNVYTEDGFQEHVNKAWSVLANVEEVAEIVLKDGIVDFSWPFQVLTHRVVVVRDAWYIEVRDVRSPSARFAYGRKVKTQKVRA